MSPAQPDYQFHSAVYDFHSPRQKAGIQEVLARISGKSTQLLSDDDVAQKLKLRGRADVRVKSIPFDAIVGSVGRYTDFTRTFLPRSLLDQARWARVKAASMDPEVIFALIEVYQELPRVHCQTREIQNHQSARDRSENRFTPRT